MTTATIRYSLNETGRKASLLAGGTGQANQEIQLDSSDPVFARVLSRAAVSESGQVTLNLATYPYPSFPEPQTALQLLEWLDAEDTRKAAEKAMAAADKRAETLAVLVERRTGKIQISQGYDRNGQEVSFGGVAHVNILREAPDLPDKASQELASSPEALAWIADLAIQNQARREQAMLDAQPLVASVIQSEKEAAEAKAVKQAAADARKIEMGGLASDRLFRIEDGVLMTCPCYDNGSRSKNWLAVISLNSASPGGLAREFATKARGDGVYIVSSLKVGDPVEFGADSYSSRGRRSPERWYGFVVALSATHIVLREVTTGKAAIKAAAKFEEALEGSTSSKGDGQ